MKILVISDTHRNLDNLELVLEKEKPIDLLLHLGDAEGQEDYIEAMAECPVEVVAGNNDFYTKLPGERIFNIGKYKVMMTHGHYYYVNGGTSHIYRAAVEKGIDIAMFGHTHRPLIKEDEQVIMLNPGSISYPRQEGRRPSYIIMDLDEEGNVHISLEFLQ